MQIGFIGSLVFAIFIAIFALQNSKSVDVKIIFTSVSIAQSLVILISASVGAVIVAILGFVRQFKLKSKIKMLNKRVVELENEVQEHKVENESEEELVSEQKEVEEKTSESIQNEVREEKQDEGLDIDKELKEKIDNDLGLLAKKDDNNK